MSKPSYSIVTDARQSGYFDAGYGVRNEADGVLENHEPFETERQAQEFLDELEERE